jgi:hypothetical protein
MVNGAPDDVISVSGSEQHLFFATTGPSSGTVDHINAHYPFPNRTLGLFCLLSAMRVVWYPIVFAVGALQSEGAFLRCTPHRKSGRSVKISSQC